MRATKEVVRQKIITARDLIKCYPLTPDVAMELFTNKGMGVFCFSAALIEWSENELNDVKRLCVHSLQERLALATINSKCSIYLPENTCR